MARTKSSITLFIESMLDKYPGLTYDNFMYLDEYKNAVSQGMSAIESPYFSAVKFRKSKNASVTAPVKSPVGQSQEPQVQEPKQPKVVSKKSLSSWEVVNHVYSQDIAETIPDVEREYVLDAKNVDVIHLVQQHSVTSNCNILLVGPAGCGKTSFAHHYAANRRAPMMVMDCANVREPRDWFGYRNFDPVSRNIVWNDSMFVRMVETPHAVIVLDEFNRVSPMVTNTLIPLLDHRGKTYLEEAGRNIRIAPGVTFWATMNEGNQFTGTISMDAAMKNRFSYIVECSFLDPDTETNVLHAKTGLYLDDCKRLVEIANQVRLKAASDSADAFSEPISTRVLESAAKGMVMGGKKTLQFTLLNHYSSGGGASSERESLRKLLVGKFGSL